MTLVLGSKNDFWISKLRYDFLSVYCSSDIPLPPVYLQCVAVIVTVAPACPVSAYFGSFDGRERRAPFMWFVSHVLLCETRAALWARPPLAALPALVCFLCRWLSWLPWTICLFSFFYGVYTHPMQFQWSMCCLFPLLSSSEGLDLRRQSLTLSPTTVANTTCLLLGSLIFSLLEMWNSPLVLFFNPVVTNFSYLTTRHPLWMRYPPKAGLK